MDFRVPCMRFVSGVVWCAVLCTAYRCTTRWSSRRWGCLPPSSQVRHRSHHTASRKMKSASRRRAACTLKSRMPSLSRVRNSWCMRCRCRRSRIAQPTTNSRSLTTCSMDAAAEKGREEREKNTREGAGIERSERRSVGGEKGRDWWWWWWGGGGRGGGKEKGKREKEE